MSPPAVLLSPQQLASRIAALAGEIRATLPDDDIHFVCVLKGAFLFLADLLRSLDDRVTIDFIGFTIEDHFVVGYGLDFNEKFRGLPYIGVLDS